MSESTGTVFNSSDPGPEIVHEAYSFACMRCSHAWEQAYELEHHINGEGRTVVTYLVDGKRVPSPLSRPTCENCDGHIVRILEAGKVSNPHLRRLPRLAKSVKSVKSADSASSAAAVGPTAPEGAEAQDGGPGTGGRHWHLPRLFQRKSRHVA